MKRYAGVLLPLRSLPSNYGFGCFDKAAYDFVDWLEKSGQRYWQILPLGMASHEGAADSLQKAKGTAPLFFFGGRRHHDNTFLFH